MFMRPLADFLKNTQELAELDHLRAELESQIINPIRREHRKSATLSVGFGVVGLLAAGVSIVGLLLSWSSRNAQLGVLEHQDSALAELHNTLQADKAAWNGVKQVLAVIEDNTQSAAARLQMALRDSATIVTTVNSISDRIDRPSSRAAMGTASQGDAPESMEDFAPGLARLRSAFTDPREAFVAAILEGNINEAEALLPKLTSILEPADLARAAIMILPAGSHRAAEIAHRLLDREVGALLQAESGENTHLVSYTIGALVVYHSRHDRESEGLVRLEPTFSEILGRDDLSKEDRVFILNQKQKLLFGAAEYEKALSICEEVLALSPDDVSYVFNASLIYEQLDLQEKCLEFVDRYMKLEGVDEDHLLHAVRKYAEANRDEDAREAFARLRAVSPVKAAMAVLDDHVKRVLESE